VTDSVRRDGQGEKPPEEFKAQRMTANCLSKPEGETDFLGDTKTQGQCHTDRGELRTVGKRRSDRSRIPSSRQNQQKAQCNTINRRQEKEIEPGAHVECGL